MIFSRSQDFDESEIRLSKNFLENLIGQNEEYCCDKAEERGFIYLDHWNEKIGFVKEDPNKYWILSLQFENNECYFYQLITKESGRKWQDGKVLDYNIVRELGIIDEESKGQST